MRLYPTDPNPSLSAAWLDDITAMTSIGPVSYYLQESINFYLGAGTVVSPMTPSKFTSLDKEDQHWLLSSADHPLWLLRYAARIQRRLSPETQEKYLPCLQAAATALAERRSAWPTHYPSCLPPNRAVVNSKKKADYRDETDTCLAYRKLLSYTWSQSDQRRVTWKNLGIRPHWY